MTKRASLEEKPSPGQPEYKPTEQQREWVRFALAMGAKKESIVSILDISPPTFDKHFPLEWAEGKLELGLRVSEEVVKRAFGYQAVVMMQKRKKGNLCWDKAGEPMMVPKTIWVAGDNNLLLRLFNAWVSKEVTRKELTGADGKDLPESNSFTTYELPLNGRETGSGGSRLTSLQRMRDALEAEIAAAGKAPLNGSGQTRH